MKSIIKTTFFLSTIAIITLSTGCHRFTMFDSTCKDLLCVGFAQNGTEKK